jgi:hypothetical protein
VIGESAQQRRASHAESSGAALTLGRGDGLTPTVIRGEEVEELGRLVDHLASSFRSMNLAGSKFIERTPNLSSTNCEKALS